MAGQHMALSDEELAAQESVEQLRLSYSSLRNHHEDVKAETQLRFGTLRTQHEDELHEAQLRFMALKTAVILTAEEAPPFEPDESDESDEPSPTEPIVHPAPMRIIKTGTEQFSIPLMITAITNGFLITRGGKNEETLYCAGPDELKASIGAGIDSFISWIADYLDKAKMPDPSGAVSAVAEQQARDMLTRIGIPNANDGNAIKIGNLSELIALISSMASLGPRISKLEQTTVNLMPTCVACGRPAHYGEFCKPDSYKP